MLYLNYSLGRVQREESSESGTLRLPIKLCEKEKYTQNTQT